MKLKMINASVVLLGQSINPIAFSYEYSLATKIAKKSWQLIQEPLMLPGISLLRFDNGLSILVNPNRIQVNLDNPTNDLIKTLLVDIARRIARHFSNSRETALGFNIAGIIPVDNATILLRYKFLKTDVLDEELKDIGINLSHPRTDAVLTLSYNSGEAKFEGDAHVYKGIVVTANYHSEFSASLTLDARTKRALQQIGLSVERYTEFFSILTQVFELEDSNDESV